MKKLLNGLFAPLSINQVKNLTSETKETLAVGNFQQSNHVFTTADLWNIQRQGKTRPQRRFL